MLTWEFRDREEGRVTDRAKRYCIVQDNSPWYGFKVA